MVEIINAGTATFNNGSTTVTFTGADFFSKGANEGLVVLIINILKRFAYVDMFNSF